MNDFFKSGGETGAKIEPLGLSKKDGFLSNIPGADGKDLSWCKLGVTEGDVGPFGVTRVVGDKKIEIWINVMQNPEFPDKNGNPGLFFIMEQNIPFDLNVEDGSSEEGRTYEEAREEIAKNIDLLEREAEKRGWRVLSDFETNDEMSA